MNSILISNEGALIMEEVNALKLRNNLGEILDRLRDKGEPILISKGRKIGCIGDSRSVEL
jgi:PHD/YefM family antitoxin component YafN of YafNO toxin-antitoxin module